MNRPVIVAAVCLAAASAIGTQTGLLLEVPLAVWLVIAGAAVLLGGFHRGLARALPYVILAAAACSDSLIPATCCTAPEIPQAK